MELLIFDWDGTVVDSIKHIVLSWTSAFDGWHKRRAAERRSEGLGDVGVPAAGELKRCIGLSVEATVRRLVPDATEEDKRVITDLYRKHFRAGRKPRGSSPLAPCASAFLSDIFMEKPPIPSLGACSSRR